jgi:hypothetical protein
MEKNMNNFWLDGRQHKSTPQGTSDDGVAEMMEAYRSQLEDEYLVKAELLEDEYNAKLMEAYEQLSEELRASEQMAKKGYQQAWDFIQNLQAELASEKQRKCPDCGYRPGERGKNSQNACDSSECDNQGWAIDL